MSARRVTIPVEGVPTSRAAARAEGARFFFVGSPCVNGHLAVRRTSTGHCIECRRDASRDHCRRNPASNAKKVAAWRIANPERAKEGQKRWVAGNPETVRGKAKRHYRRYRHTFAEKVARRAAAKASATPSWLTAEQRAEMRGFYLESQRLSVLTGVPHHVDHIVPIRGRAVCGLHVPWNLQVIPASSNRRKHNRYE